VQLSSCSQFWLPMQALPPPQGRPSCVSPSPRTGPRIHRAYMCEGDDCGAVHHALEPALRGLLGAPDNTTNRL
jgi:hypothetical protein